MGEEEAFDNLELIEELARHRPVFDELVRVPPTPLNQQVEQLLPDCQQIADLLHRFQVQVIPVRGVQLENDLSRQIVRPGPLLLVGDELVLDLGDFLVEVSDRVGDGARFGEVSGNIRPPPADAAPIAVGFELAAGQLGDAVEFGLVSARDIEGFHRLLGAGHDAVRRPQRLCQFPGFGRQLCQLWQLF